MRMNERLMKSAPKKNGRKNREVIEGQIENLRSVLMKTLGNEGDGPRKLQDIAGRHNKGCGRPKKPVLEPAFDPLAHDCQEGPRQTEPEQGHTDDQAGKVDQLATLM